MYTHRNFAHPGGVSPMKQEDNFPDPNRSTKVQVKEKEEKKKTTKKKKEEVFSENLKKNVLNKKPEVKSSMSTGDKVDLALSGAGMVPAWGAIPDAVNVVQNTGQAVFNAVTGDFKEAKKDAANAAWALGGLIPLGIGQAITSAKIAKNVTKVAKGADTVIDASVKTEKGAKAVVNVASETAEGAGKHFKSTLDRTVPVRGGQQFDDAMGEYNSLLSMHNAFPNNVVKPTGVVFDKAGKMLGYNMDKVKGVDLDQWMQQGNKMTQKMKDEIVGVITELNKKGIYHGDLKPNNIMIDSKGVWKLIDPVGFSMKESSNVLDAAKRLDANAIRDIDKWQKWASGGDFGGNRYIHYNVKNK